MGGSNAKEIDSTGSLGVQPMVSSGSQSALLSAKYLIDKLEEAELLLAFAAQQGIEIDEKVSDNVLKARIASSVGFSNQIASDLLVSVTKLAVSVRPVTAQSLRAVVDHEGVRKQISFYGWAAGIIACVLLLFSLLTFVSGRISEKIKADVEIANGLAAKLSAELGPESTNYVPKIGSSRTEKRFGTNGIPSGLTEREVITDLQQFAATMREIDGYAWLLNHFVFFNKVTDPLAEQRATPEELRKKLELTPDLGELLSKELATKIEVYQEIRYFGTQVQERVGLWYGAIAASVLPVLYALLGAGAYLLRSYEDQIKNRTLVTGDRHVARFLIAGIGGLVVGLFNFNVTQGVSVSPFAVAFLVGYAVDVFFAFLEGLLQAFRRGPATTAAQGASPRT